MKLFSYKINAPPPDGVQRGSLAPQTDILSTTYLSYETYAIKEFSLKHLKQRYCEPFSVARTSAAWRAARTSFAVHHNAASSEKGKTFNNFRTFTRSQGRNLAQTVLYQDLALTVLWNLALTVEHGLASGPDCLIARAKIWARLTFIRSTVDMITHLFRVAGGVQVLGREAMRREMHHLPGRPTLDER